MKKLAWIMLILSTSAFAAGPFLWNGTRAKNLESGGMINANGTVGAPSYSFITDLTTGMYRRTTNTIDFATAGVNRMSVLANGNVGIGTTAPAYELDVVGTGNASTFRIRSSGNNASATISNSGTGGATWNLSSTNNASSVGGGKFIIDNNVSNFMVIDSSGNIGIGTNTPTANLSVAELFQVDSNGNPIKINNVTTSFPASQGAASTFLQNNGSGVLTWAAGGTGTMAIGETVTSGTTGSLLFVGAGPVLAQNNAKAFWDNTNSRLGIGTATPAAPLEVDAQATGTKGIISKNIAAQTASNFEAQNSSGTAYVKIGPDTLPGNSPNVNFLNVTGTLPATLTNFGYGANFNITGAGTSNQIVAAVNVNLNAGYTGSAPNIGIFSTNATAGTGTNPFSGTSQSNYGQLDSAAGVTTGTNVALGAVSSGGNVNYGVLGETSGTKNSATNVAVAGFSVNAGTSPIEVGGYFSLAKVTPTYVSAALIADNGAESAPIFIGRANGTEKFRIDTGGNVGIAISSPSTQLSVADKFEVDVNGNILKINNVATSFPASQGAASTFLKNDGSGNLSWAAPTVANVTQSTAGLVASAGQLLGTNTNDTASAGNVGETVTSYLVPGSALTVTTGTYTDITSISLTAGTWQVAGVACLNGGITGIQLTAGITGTAGNSATGYNIGDTAVSSASLSSASADECLTLAPYNVFLSGTSNYYLKTQDTFTVGTLKAYGRISATRIR